MLNDNTTLSSTTTMFEHSEAKVGLYENYLLRYLNILSRSFVKKIYLYDMFCGEGVYENGGQGSPLMTIDCIARHYRENNNTCPNIAVVFNDKEESKIEPGKLKVDRVKEFVEAKFIPDQVKIWYTKFSYSDLVKRVIKKLDQLNNNERALIFIDPWGYKDIDPNDLKALMKSNKAEVLLFLPISFMYRFANKAAVSEKFEGGRPIRKLLDTLYDSITKPYFRDQQHFISELQIRFKAFSEATYLDTFKIERSANNWFALFFFTNNQKGYWKMLDSKWTIDTSSGKAFQKNRAQVSLSTDFDLHGYRDIVEKYLRQNLNATNADLLELGLQNNFLPKHTRQILDSIKKDVGIDIISLDRQPATSYYLGNEDRLVNIKLR